MDQNGRKAQKTSTKRVARRIAKSGTKPAGKAQQAKQPKILSSRVAFKGRVFSVTVEDVLEPTGVRARRDTVRHQGSVVILPLQEDDTSREPRLLLEWQYRYPANSWLWELPAGRIDDGERELEAAKRELLEETGYSARSWRRIVSYYASPGFMDETMNIYLAQGLEKGKAQPEDDEVIRTRFFPLSAALKLAAKGKIRDGKTLVAIYWLAHQTKELL